MKQIRYAKYMPYSDNLMLKNSVPYFVGVIRNGTLEILPKQHDHFDQALTVARIMSDLKQENLRVEIRQGYWKSGRPLYIFDSANL